MNTINLLSHVSNVLNLNSPRENERVGSLLANENIHTIGMLCRTPRSELRKIHTLGVKSIESIRLELAKYLLRLGMSNDELAEYDELFRQERASELEAEGFKENYVPAMHVVLNHYRKCIDWDNRFFEVAKEEFLRMDRTVLDDVSRAKLAVQAAEAFMVAFVERSEIEMT